MASSSLSSPALELIIEKPAVFSWKDAVTPILLLLIERMSPSIFVINFEVESNAVLIAAATWEELEVDVIATITPVFPAIKGLVPVPDTLNQK